MCVLLCVARACDLCCGRNRPLIRTWGWRGGQLLTHDGGVIREYVLVLPVGSRVVLWSVFVLCACVRRREQMLDESIVCVSLVLEPLFGGV